MFRRPCPRTPLATCTPSSHEEAPHWCGPMRKATQHRSVPTCTSMCSPPSCTSLHLNLPKIAAHLCPSRMLWLQRPACGYPATIWATHLGVSQPALEAPGRSRPRLGSEGKAQVSCPGQGLGGQLVIYCHYRDLTPSTLGRCGACMGVVLRGGEYMLGVGCACTSLCITI